MKNLTELQKQDQLNKIIQKQKITPANKQIIDEAIKTCEDDAERMILFMLERDLDIGDTYHEHNYFCDQLLESCVNRAGAETKTESENNNNNNSRVLS